MFDGWGCSRLLLPRGRRSEEELDLCERMPCKRPSYTSCICGYDIKAYQGWNCRAAIAWYLLCSTYSMFRLVCVCFPEKQSFLSVTGVWVVIYSLVKGNNFWSKLKTSKTTAVGRCFRPEPYWTKPRFLELLIRGHKCQWRDRLAESIGTHLTETEASTWCPNVSMNSEREICEASGHWGPWQASSFWWLQYPLPGTPSPTVCQAQQASAADLLQAALEVQDEVAASMLLGGQGSQSRDCPTLLKLWAYSLCFDALILVYDVLVTLSSPDLSWKALILFW